MSSWPRPSNTSRRDTDSCLLLRLETSFSQCFAMSVNHLKRVTCPSTLSEAWDIKSEKGWNGHTLRREGEGGEWWRGSTVGVTPERDLSLWPKKDSTGPITTKSVIRRHNLYFDDLRYSNVLFSLCHWIGSKKTIKGVEVDVGDGLW